MKICVCSKTQNRVDMKEVFVSSFRSHRRAKKNSKQSTQQSGNLSTKLGLLAATDLQLHGMATGWQSEAARQLRPRLAWPTASLPFSVSLEEARAPL